jgi:hypothetical protein
MGLFKRASAPRRATIAGVVIAAAGIVVASSGGSVHADPVLGGQLFSGGECAITVTVQDATAGYTSNLKVYLADGTLFNDPLVTNHDVGQTRTFTGPAAGEELVFAISVQNTGDLFKMGPGTRNLDNIVHATVNDNGNDTFTVGFEDLFGGGDADYDDNVFLFEGCIEPITAVNDTATTPEDTPVGPIDVLANDGGVGIEVISVGSPANGTAVIDGSGVTYTPNLNFNGSDSFTYTIEDDSGAPATATVTVTVTSVNDPPVCSAATPSQSVLWPPDHRRVPITINGVTDVDGNPITIAITTILQDERTNKLGDGDTDIDGGTAPGTAFVRAERSGNGNGRVYHIGFTASDGSGGSCTGTVLVAVPHDLDGAPAVDDGALYNSMAATV